jgi:hypothetical protein
MKIHAAASQKFAANDEERTHRVKTPPWLPLRTAEREPIETIEEEEMVDTLELDIDDSMFSTTKMDGRHVVLTEGRTTPEWKPRDMTPMRWRT